MAFRTEVTLRVSRFETQKPEEIIVDGGEVQKGTRGLT